MYVYNDQDYISNSIRFGQSWESTETKQIINAGRNIIKSNIIKVNNAAQEKISKSFWKR